MWCPYLLTHICITWPQWVKSKFSGSLGSKWLQQQTHKYMFHSTWSLINTLRLRQNGRHFQDVFFQMHFLKWICMNFKNFIKTLLKFVPKGPINNIPSLVQIRAWHWPGNKPLSQLMKVDLLMHICITRPQWINFLSFRWPANQD